MTQDQALVSRAKEIRLAVFDVDGVLTDGRIMLHPDGRESKVFHARDGLGIRLLRQLGIEVAVISGRRSEVVEKRMSALDVGHVYQGQDDKAPIFEALLKKLSMKPEHALYCGDDVIDIPVMRLASIGVAVRDAHPTVLTEADWITTLNGGRGAVREICDWLLDAQRGTDTASGYRQ